MAYNITLIDAKGHAAAGYLSPDKAPFVAPEPFAANQQQTIDWPYYAKLTETELRHQSLAALAQHPNEPKHNMVHHFLHKPLFCENYYQNFGTLYTAVYDTRQRSAQLFWPDDSAVTQTFNNFLEDHLTLQLAAMKRRGSLYK